MKNTWHDFLQASLDYLMCHYDRPRILLEDPTFERKAWLAWSGGREVIGFVDEYMIKDLT